ncbi:MAG: glycosyltransferase family 4 protein [Phycisphaerae bacterium]|nr:glycosyltransferase family 4 protein [Phycisphaerae bacterium]
MTEETPIRVCFVSPKSYPLFRPETPGVFGGAEVDLFLLGNELAKDPRFVVSFVVADYGQPVEDRVDAIRLIRSVNFSSPGLFGAIRVLRALRIADANVYMIKTASPGVPMTAAFCRRFRRAFVYRTAHQEECDGSWIRRHPLLGRGFRWALGRASVILAQNQNNADDLKRTTGLDSIVIPNGHPMLPLNPTSNRDSILWVGRSAVFKHPDMFLSLADRFPQERFVMICQEATQGVNYESLRRAAADRSNLEFHDRVPFREIDPFFERAKVLVNTSDSEGFSNAFIQACVHGVPILSLTVNPDLFLTRHLCGIDCGSSQDRLVEGLRFLLEGDRYIELGKNARAYAERYHDIARIVDRYKELFIRLSADRRR